MMVKPLSTGKIVRVNEGKAAVFAAVIDRSRQG